MVKKQVSKKIRYAVVGLGYISQAAVLPAFAHAGKNSELTALISNDETKLRQLGKKYSVKNLYRYSEYETALNSGDFDAVYIALPNHLHCEYTVRAAQAGIHVLCEKPMAITVEECERMIEVSREHHIKLMLAYRLHFEKANLKAIALSRKNKLGEPRIFNSLFTMQIKPGNIRLKRNLGGGTLYDIGIYCINAARHLFDSEPMEVMAISANNGDKRFDEVDEMTSAVMRFPKERLATFASSFGASDVSSFKVVGTKGSLWVDRAYEITEGKVYQIKTQGKSKRSSFAKRDQFAAVLLYFSDCIKDNREPEPSGEEGLADVRVIEALYASARSGKAQSLADFKRNHRPSLDMEIKRPPVRKQRLVHAEAPSR